MPPKCFRDSRGRGRCGEILALRPPDVGADRRHAKRVAGVGPDSLSLKCGDGAEQKEPLIMTIELKPEQERIIQQQLATGLYGSVDEVLASA
jgi:hypothetical protein